MKLKVKNKEIKKRDKALGMRIQFARKMAAMSLHDLAMKTNIGKDTLWRIEKGRQNPRFYTLRKIIGEFPRDMQNYIIIGE